MKDRLKTGYYKVPERAGVSYMLSPILRTYVNPEESDSVATSNNPHVMYYAPNVSNEDVGGKPPGIRVEGYGMSVSGFYPFVIMPGPHGYMIHLVGLAERAA